MRRLAAEIGVGGTTLYRNVRDREDLLILLINEHTDRTLQVQLPHDPRERIIAATVAIHDALAAQPWAAEVLTADGFLDRVGRSALLAVEGVVSGALDCGCSQQQAVELFRSVWYFTVGEILVRANTRKRGVTAEARPARLDSFLATLDGASFPALASIGADWPVHSARDNYAEALRAFVDGLLADVHQR